MNEQAPHMRPRFKTDLFRVDPGMFPEREKVAGDRVTLGFLANDRVVSMTRPLSGTGINGFSLQDGELEGMLTKAQADPLFEVAETRLELVRYFCTGGWHVEHLQLPSPLWFARCMSEFENSMQWPAWIRNEFEVGSDKLYRELATRTLARIGPVQSPSTGNV